jgi:hypothetical protein
LTGKWPDGTVEPRSRDLVATEPSPVPPHLERLVKEYGALIRDWWKLDGKLQGHREGRQEGLRAAMAERGRLGGSTQKTEKSWKRPARKIVKDIEAKKSMASDSEVADHIIADWANKGRKSPPATRKTVLRFLKQFRESGNRPQKPVE